MKRSRRERGKEEAENGGAGMPVNSCTMARKLEVSVVRTVVGARREALDRFLGFRVGLGWSMAAEAQPLLVLFSEGKETDDGLRGL